MKLSCEKATELVEKRSLVGLTLFERMKLRLHLSMCSDCKNYEQQSLLIDKSLEGIPDKSNPIQYTEEEKQKILDRCKGEQ